ASPDVANAKADVVAAKMDLVAAKVDVAAAKVDMTDPHVPWNYELPQYQVELLSRQVMRVVIPSGVYSCNGKVDIHIATPYGVSQYLQVPILSDTPAAPPPPAPPGYVLDADNRSMAIRYSWEPVAGGGFNPKFERRSGNFRINWFEE